MQKTGKPFVVVVNTQDAKKGQADAICARIREEYGVQALAMDCAVMQTQDIGTAVGSRDVCVPGRGTAVLPTKLGFGRCRMIIRSNPPCTTQC